MSASGETGAGEPIPVEAFTHDGDSRVNIPTEELRDFAAADETAPAEVLYPRDPSLDPQLVWKGKDAQDGAPLEVPAVPIYIQEKIHPRVLIENLRDTAAAGEPEPELSLFDGFDGLGFDELVEFYEHDQNWSNRMVLGDALLVMTSLAEKERLKGKVQTIYLDPPYGIRFGSNWQVSTRKRDVADGKAADLTRQPEMIKAFRDTWEHGVSSYLAYLRDRLVVARELLTETGSVFVQIGDENVHLVRSVLDEVFGRENFVSLITFKKTSGAGSFAGGTNVIASVGDYLVWYAKDASRVKYRQLYKDKEVGGAGSKGYTWVELPDGSRVRAESEDVLDDRMNRVFQPTAMTSQTVREAQTTVFPIDFEGSEFLPDKGGWKTNQDGVSRLAAADRLIRVGNILRYVRYIDDFPAFPLTNMWDDTVTAGFASDKVYVVQTNTKVVQRCLLMTTDPGDLVLDPTCGSGTTAHVAEQWGRRWITIDSSRVALALARTRLMSAKYPSYLLADSPEGAAKDAALRGGAPPEPPPKGRDVRKGFVNRRVPHIMLKSIAQNPDIHEGMSRAEVDAAIARHADVEVLVDQPYVDGAKVRVAGPFTVESLSPHRVLDTSMHRSGTERAAETAPDSASSYESTILDNMRAAGVQNTVRDERLEFASLEPFAGTWIQAEGEFEDGDGRCRRVAVSLGPEYGTVGHEWVKEAAKEAVRGVGFDILLVCGFAFDSRAGEAAKEFAPAESGGFTVADERQVGRLPVLLVRMNPDLAMGADLLKKTGSGNLFMVFGEPDITIERTADDGVVVELLGVDVYDPTTGELRSNSVDDVACWFVDTNYNGESFFVRHAYFLGAAAKKPYEALQRALKSDVDADAWASLYSARSRPFGPPGERRIAVKVINHYGDEVMKTYEILD